MNLNLASRLKELNQRKKELNDELKNVNAEIEAVEQELASDMLNDEVQNFTYDGTLFYLSSKVYANPEPTLKDTLFARLKEMGYGDLVYETVNSNTFAAFIREQLEQNDDKLPEWLNGLVKVYEKTTIGLRKSK